MIRRSFLITMLVVSSLVVWQGRIWQSQLAATLNVLQSAPKADEVSVRHSYVIDDQWLRFPVPRQADHVRILTTAVFRRPLPELDLAALRPGWRYAIEYELLNDRGEVIRASTSHFRSQVNQYMDPDSHQPYSRSRFDDTDLIPASSRRILVPSRSTQEPVECRVRLISKDTEIQSVVVRMASVLERFDFDNPDMWQRKSIYQKESLCRSLVYPHELLTQEQRANALRWQTFPTPPLGMEERDYQRMVMYTRNEVRGVECGTSVVPEGLLVPEGKRRYIKLPNVMGHIQIRVEAAVSPIDRQDTAPEIRTLATVIQQDVRKQQIARHEFTPSNQPGVDASFVTASKQIEVNGGALEVFADETVAIGLTWLSEEGDRDLTPLAKATFLYACADAPVTFSVQHVGDQPTPVRLTARQIVASDHVEQESCIRWSFLNADGQVLLTDELLIPRGESDYDWVQLPDPAESVGDRVELFWMVPTTACQMKVEAITGRPLVSVATRPIGVPARQLIGETQFSEDDDATPVRSWFPVRPERYADLKKYRNLVRVNLASRPPETDLEILAGNYLWEDFRPAGSWVGREMLVPRLAGRETRLDAMPVTYHEIPVNEVCHVEVVADGIDAVEMAVAILHPSETGDEVSLHLNGQQVESTHRRSGHDVLKLNEVPTGLHTIEVRTQAPVRALVNNIRGAGLSFVKRIGIEVPAEGITLRVDKGSTDEELLLLDYFALNTEEAESLTSLTVKLLATESPPFETLSACSPTEWQLLVDPTTEIAEGFVLGTSSKVIAGRRAYLWLGENIPPGEYELQIQTNDESVAYVVVSRTTPGQFPRRRFSHQNKDGPK